jgi:hypothetical protein
MTSEMWPLSSQEPIPRTWATVCCIDTCFGIFDREGNVDICINEHMLSGK